ncbi:hypothetical protein [Halalkalicoccus subterraneus]|uniref:hypothetical protein n=1 Tax=Halalkalicoccus subterraneus TaxID=2675002 RepID=UPI000EFC347F|nr:hypothetical protein [Halalkalicoccus subterraneus]
MVQGVATGGETETYRPLRTSDVFTPALGSCEQVLDGGTLRFCRLIAEFGFPVRDAGLPSVADPLPVL